MSPLHRSVRPDTQYLPQSHKLEVEMFRLNRVAEAPEARSAMIERAVKVVIDALKERGIRKDYVVLVGGGTLNEKSARAAGADLYCRDALVAEGTVKAILAKQ